MSSTSGMFKVNDFVWAKMARCPPWPAVVMEPDPLAPPKQKNSYWIYFFGSHDYAWIEERHIKPFDAYKDQYKATYKQGIILEAIEELEEIIEKMVKNPEYKIEFIKYTRKDRRQRKRTSSANSGEKKATSSARGKKDKSSSRKRSRSSSSIRSHKAIPPTDICWYGDKPTKESDDDNGLISQKTFGFFAINVNAEGIMKNLMTAGHRIEAWSTSAAMCEDLEAFATKKKKYFKVRKTPRELVRNCDVVFSYMSDPEYPKEFVKKLGVMDDDDNLLDGKGYVELTSVDPDTSVELCKLIERKGGTYIEAMLQGTLRDANTGELVIVTAGKMPPFNECQSCFRSMGKSAFLLENIGTAAKINMIFQMMRGIQMAGFAEAYALADKCGVLPNVLNDIFSVLQISSSYLRDKADIILGKKYSETKEPVQQIQEALAHVRKFSEQYRQPLPMASNANEIFKHARRLGYDNLDSACVYTRTRY